MIMPMPPWHGETVARRHNNPTVGLHVREVDV